MKATPENILKARRYILKNYLKLMGEVLEGLHDDIETADVHSHEGVVLSYDQYWHGPGRRRFSHYESEAGIRHIALTATVFPALTTSDLPDFGATMDSSVISVFPIGSTASTPSLSFRIVRDDSLVPMHPHVVELKKAFGADPEAPVIRKHKDKAPDHDVEQEELI